MVLKGHGRFPDIWMQTGTILAPPGPGGDLKKAGVGVMASAVVLAYNGGLAGGLGRSPQRGPGAEPLVRGSGGEDGPPEAESFSAFGRLT